MLKSSPLHNAAGKRNTWITVQRMTDADANDIGEVLPEASVLCEQWAAAKPTYTKEYQVAMTTQPLLYGVYELPYDPETATITPKDRVLLDGRLLNLAGAINEGENNEKILLWVVEPVAT